MIERSVGAWFAVFAGGTIGAGVRAAIEFSTPDAHPWQILVVNVAGSLALGVLVARVWPTASAWVRAGLGTGLLGGFTTFSALALAVAQSFTALTLAYLVASLVLGVAAAWLGLRLGGNTHRAVEVDE